MHNILSNLWGIPPLSVRPPEKRTPRRYCLRCCIPLVKRHPGECPERQGGRTVNPLAYAFVGSNSTSPTQGPPDETPALRRDVGAAAGAASCVYDCSTDAGSTVRSARPFRRGKGSPKEYERRAQSTGDGEVVLYGWHTVTAALANPERHIRKLWATENAARRLTDAGIKLTVTPEMVRPDAIAARLSPDAVHQGLLAEADPLPARELADLPAAGLVLALDQITDPHNVGAILRTAAAFAVGAVITTARYSPDATGVLAKSASGALEWVPMVAVTNLSRALDELKERAFQVSDSTAKPPRIEARSRSQGLSRWCSARKVAACGKKRAPHAIASRA